MKITQMFSRLKALYRLAIEVGIITGLFKFSLFSELLSQEMECIIDSDDVVQFASMQDISVNCIAVYMKYSITLNIYCFFIY